MKKQLLIKTTLLFCSVMSLWSCGKDTVPGIFAPTINTGQVTDIYRKGASIHGSIQNPDAYPVETFGIELTQVSRPGLTIEQYFATAQRFEVDSTDEQGNFSVQLSGLNPGVTYLYRSFISSGYNDVFAADSFFLTPQNTAPVFADAQATNVTYTSFDISVELLDDGGEEMETMAYLYKEMPEGNEEELSTRTPDVLTVYVNSLSEANTYTASVQNLYAGSRYAIRPYGVAFTTGYGKTMYVQTQSSDATLLSACDTSRATYNSLHVNASILAENKQYPVESVGFCYSSESTEPTVANLTVPATLNATEFEATLTQLNSDTHYYIRAYAKTSNNQYVYGEVLGYDVILHEILEVSTMPADNITSVGARLKGMVRNNNVTIKERGFCWSMENRSPDIDNSPHQLAALSEEELYSLEMEANYNSTYYYRAYAKNTKGEVYYGQVFSFTSEDIGIPQIKSYEAVNITEAGASIAMTVALHYGYRDEHPIEYGVVLSSINQDPYVGGDNITRNYKEVLLDANLDGDVVNIEDVFSFKLSPDTQYYYRVYAKNSKDIQYGNLGSFTTPKRTPTQNDVNYPQLQP